jgi:hypothetical protein
MNNSTRFLCSKNLRLVAASLLLSGIAMTQSGCLLAAAGAAGAGAGYVAAKSTEPNHTDTTTVEEVHEDHTSITP